jgi:hypothetical protein
MASRIFLPIAFLMTTVLIVAAARPSDSVVSSNAGQVRTTAAPQNPRFLANDLPLLPANIDRGARPLSMMRATFLFAARHPEVMKFVPCFCGCERSLSHKDNQDCFVAGRNAAGAVTAWEPHGAVCEICNDVAYQAYQMHESGATVTAIREAIEKKYAERTASGLHTPTPLPKRGGMSHH